MTLSNKKWSKVIHWSKKTKEAINQPSYLGTSPLSKAFTQENTPTFATKKRANKKKRPSKHKRSTTMVPPPPVTAPTQPNPTVAAGVVPGPAPAATLPATTPTSNVNENPATLSTPTPTEGLSQRLDNRWDEEDSDKGKADANMDSDDDVPVMMDPDDEDNKKPPAKEDSTATGPDDEEDKNEGSNAMDTSDEDTSDEETSPELTVFKSGIRNFLEKIDPHKNSAKKVQEDIDNAIEVEMRNFYSD